MNFDGKGYVKGKYVPTLNKIYFTLFYKQFNTDVHRPIGVTVSKPRGVRFFRLFLPVAERKVSMNYK
jgi:hypothetical protein